MPATQTGFGNFFLERSINMATGYQLPVLGSLNSLNSLNSLQQQQHQQHQQQQHLAAMAAAVPVSYPGLQGYNFIPFPNHRHVTQMSHGFDLKAASPYHHALLARGGPFYAPYRPAAAAAAAGAGEDPAGRVTKVATRESTGALKAWLNEHLKNPYPTKGEKIMLAIITKMSLTQVSTWFANARRRLKKENRVSWASKGKSDEEDEDQEEDSDDEDASLEKCHVDDAEAESERTGSEERAAPVDARLETQQQQEEEEEEEEEEDEEEVELVKKAETSDSDRTSSTLESKDDMSNPKPKIWSLAETATSDSPVKKHHKDSIYHPAGKLWAQWVRSGFFVPSCYTSPEMV